MARSLTGSQRRTLLRSWAAQAAAADEGLADWLQAQATAVIGSAHTGDGRAVLSTSNAGQSVTFTGADNLDPVSQAQAVALMTEAADVSHSLTYTDDDDLLVQLIEHLGTPVSSFTKSYSGIRQ